MAMAAVKSSKQTGPSMSARIHPVVLFNICDSYVRRPDQAGHIIGTLLGSTSPDGTVEIRTPTSLIPHNESADQVALDIDYHHNMFASHQKVNPKEALLDASALKSLISQWQNMPLSWNESTDPCDKQWDGIQCSKGRVTSLSLPGMNIKGKISVDISLLTELTILDLASNPDLVGSLPESIGQLQKLTSLSLLGCNLTGTISTTIGNLKNLIFLALNSNKFSGSIPSTNWE